MRDTLPRPVGAVYCNICSDSVKELLTPFSSCGEIVKLSAFCGHVVCGTPLLGSRTSKFQAVLETFIFTSDT